MAKQTVKTSTTTRTTYRKSASGQKHCPVCGKFMKKK